MIGKKFSHFVYIFFITRVNLKFEIKTIQSQEEINLQFHAKFCMKETTISFNLASVASEMAPSSRMVLMTPV